jgi:hypothetical protein
LTGSKNEEKSQSDLQRIKREREREGEREKIDGVWEYFQNTYQSMIFIYTIFEVCKYYGFNFTPK